MSLTLITQKPEPATPDVVLAFVDSITCFTRSWRYYLFADAQRVAEAKIEAAGERCAFFMKCSTQYEQQSWKDYEFPASKDDSIIYYDTAQPNRPPYGSFVEKKEQFPLRDKRKFVDCSSCSATGKVQCQTCRGRGRHKDRACTNCAGTGLVRCKRCAGERSLITYKAHEFHFYHKADMETLIPQEIKDFGGRTKVRSHADKAFQRADAHFILESFTADEVRSRLRVQNEEMVEATHQANSEFDRLHKTARERSGEVLFHVFTRKVTPISYLNVRTGGRFGQFWAVGVRGHHTISLPPLPWDRVKLLAWLTVTVTILCSVAAFSAHLLPWAALAFALSAMLTGLLSWCAVRRHRAVRPDRLIAVAGRESEDKSRLFALAGELLCFQERAGFGDACHEQLFDLLRMDLSRTDLSATYRLSLHPLEGTEADPVRLFMVSEASLTSASPEADRTLAAADTLLLVASDGGEEDDTLFDRILAALEQNPVKPEVRLIVPLGMEPGQILPNTCQRLPHFPHQYLPMDIALLRERFLEHQTQEPDTITMFRMLAAPEPPQEGAPT